VNFQVSRDMARKKLFVSLFQRYQLRVSWTGSRFFL